MEKTFMNRQQYLEPHHLMAKFVGGLGTGVGCQAHRLPQRHGRQLLDLVGHGGAKQQRLPLCGCQFHDFPNFFCKAHFQQPVSLVQHQHLQVFEPHRGAVAHVIDQAALQHDGGDVGGVVGSAACTCIEGMCLCVNGSAHIFSRPWSLSHPNALSFRVVLNEWMMQGEACAAGAKGPC